MKELSLLFSECPLNQQYFRIHQLIFIVQQNDTSSFEAHIKMILDEIKS